MNVNAYVTLHAAFNKVEVYTVSLLYVTAHFSSEHYATVSSNGLASELVLKL